MKKTRHLLLLMTIIAVPLAAHGNTANPIYRPLAVARDSFC